MRVFFRTSRNVALALVALVAWVAAAQNTPPAAPPQTPRIVEMRVDGVIQPLTAEYVSDGVREAAEMRAALVLITMNTPGGLDTSMREMIQAILNSPVPVVVYVSPSGARAASAGFFILLSADVAAMAPGSDTGASSPVPLFGGGQVDETLRKKAINEAAAYLRSIAERRGRNAELAEKAVTEAEAFSEQEALRERLIDLVVGSTEELLEALDGRTIKRFDGSELTLALAGAERVAHEMNRRQRILSRIADPNILFILLIVGLLGLYAEFTNPGMIFPGVIGAVCLILALVAMQILPINIIGVLLILLAIGLFVLEAKVTSFGLLGLAGAVAMVVGALFLIRSPWTGMGVSLGTAVAVTIPFALLAIFLMTLVMRSFKWKPSTGVESLAGQIGEVTEEIDGRGMVFVAGELWRAAAATKIPKGTRVRVVRVEGLTAHVEPVEGAPAAPGRQEISS
jgi:membrane-bound serine protease (ClpP class)